MKARKSTTLITLMMSIGLLTTGCTKHDEHKAENKTEEIAAKQGEAARAANPAPVAKEPAKFVASTPANTANAVASAPVATTTQTSATSATTKVQEKSTNVATTKETSTKTEVKATEPEKK